MARSLLIIALVAAGGAALAPAVAQETVTKTQIRTAPPEETHRRLRDVVWDMFERTDFRRGKPPTRPLDGVMLSTQTRGTYVRDLCRYDVADFAFAPVDTRDRGADTRVRAVGVETTAWFHFLTPPLLPHEEPEESTVDEEEPAFGPPAWDAQCRGLGDSASFFTAPDEDVARDGVRALRALVAAAGAGAPDVKCNLGHATAIGDTEACREKLLRYDLASLWSADTCESSHLERRCFLLSLADEVRATVIVTGHVWPGPPAFQVVSAEMDQMIVMWHERVD